MKRVLIAVTGASGQIYARLIIDRLRAMAATSIVTNGEAKSRTGYGVEGIELDIIFSIPAKGVWKEELGTSYAALEKEFEVVERGNDSTERGIGGAESGEGGTNSGEGGANSKVKLINNYDFNNRNASGSNCADVMIIIPCSMGTIGRIAAGTSDTLILRAADVMLKERKRLILVPRESPYSLIHLRNMTTLTEAGAIIASAAPSFYLKPTSLEKMAGIFVSRILELAGIESIENTQRWGE